MSIDAIGSRVAEIDQMLAAVGGTQAAGTTAATSFAQALSSAQATTSTTPASAAPYAADIQAAATRYGIDPALLTGLIRQESGFDPNARSSAGAVGLTQLMPGTAASLGVDPTDPAQAIDGGARYLKAQLDRFGGDPSKALAAYNAGPGAVAQYGGVPPYAETQDYVQKVLAFADQYRAAGTTSVPATTTPVLATTASPSLDYATT